MHRRKYALREIQTEDCGSVEEETVNTKLGTIKGFTEEVVFELGLVE